METTKDIVTNKFGQVVVDSDTLRELILHGKNINHTIPLIDDDIELYQQYQAQLLSTISIFDKVADESMDIDNFHEIQSSNWLIPAEYATIDVLQWLGDKCKTEQELIRVAEEYALYEARDLIMLLRLFIYLMAYFNENKFICGVGRGSSTCSYILYLIGVHRVDSLKYNLPITDYLK